MEDKTFYLKNGKTFKNLKKFAKELKSMNKETFTHHVNETKNDFSNWVKHSLKKEDLSQKIHSKINKLEMELEILRHLVHDDKKVTKKTTKKK